MLDDMKSYFLVFLTCTSLRQAVEFTQTPNSVVYAYAKDEARIYWGYRDTQSLFRVRYGLVNTSRNIFNAILVSTTGDTTVLHNPDRVTFENSILVIKNVTTNDGGVYRCELNSLAGTIFGDTTLVVVDLSVSNSSVSNQYPVEGSRIVFKTRLMGLPSPVAKWYRGDNVVDVGASISTLVNDKENSVYELQLDVESVVRLTQDKRYVLKLTFEGLNEKIISNFDIKVRYSPGTSIKFTKNPSSEIASVGSNILLRCEASSYPLSNLTISHNENVVKEDIKSVNFSISSVDASHEGVYECAARNEIGEGVARKLMLTYGVAPYFLQDNSQVTVSSGEKVALAFRVRAKPEVSYAFTKNGVNMTSQGSIFSETVEGQVRESNITLVLENVTPQSFGLYGCHVENVLGKNTSLLFLNVTYRLQFALFKATKQIAVTGEDFVLECLAIINPGLPKYSWLKNNETISGNVADGNLRLKEVSFEDAGTYTCVVTDGNTTLKKSTELFVASKPEIYFITPESLVVIGNEANLTCRGSGVPKPSVRWRINSTSEVLSIEETFILSAKVLETKVGTSVYQCEVTNVVGTSRKYVTLTVTESSHESWVLPLLIAFLLVLIIILIVAIVYKICAAKPRRKKNKPSTLASIYNNTSTPTDVLTVNPMYHENTKQPLYLPNYSYKGTTKAISVQRMKSENITWEQFSEKNSEEESITVQMIFAEDSLSDLEGYLEGAHENIYAVPELNNETEFEEVIVDFDGSSGEGPPPEQVECSNVEVEHTPECSSESGIGSTSDIGRTTGSPPVKQVRFNAHEIAHVNESYENDDGVIVEEVDQYVDDLFDFR